MELWLLGAGAVVLIAITMWIVWPARTADTVGTPVRGEEVSKTPMTESDRPGLIPQGDRFEHQYTSATADLSAGGVATTFAENQEDRAAQPHSVPTQDAVPPTQGQRWPEASITGEPIGQASRAENFPYQTPADHGHGMLRPKTLGIGAGTLLTLGGAVGGAWLYARWQRERNKPINRLRRGARDMASRVHDRLPDVMEDLPVGSAPIGGAASALLLAALLGTRALRHSGSDERVDDVREQARDLVRESLKEALGFGRENLTRDTLKDAVGRGRDVGRDSLKDAVGWSREAVSRDALKSVLGRGREAASSGSDMLERGRKESRRWTSRLPTDRLSGVEAPQPGIFGLGFGGLAVVVGGTYVVWRLLRRGSGSDPQNTWYAGE